MDATLPERVAVVSCHVERPLDDLVWARFSELQERRPGGLAIVALMRPADAGAGEDEGLWAARAHQATARGPLGQHTHWTAPDHARPTGGDPGARVLEEGRRLRELGLRPTLFCGGGWYTDAGVAETCAELGYADCTPRASRPAYLGPDEPWAALERPARIRLPSGRPLPALPTTHSPGELARALARRAAPRYVHLYFHDTDLVDRRRRALVRALLAALGRRAVPLDPIVSVRTRGADLPEIAWDDVARL